MELKMQIDEVEALITLNPPKGWNDKNSVKINF